MPVDLQRKLYEMLTVQFDLKLTPDKSSMTSTKFLSSVSHRETASAKMLSSCCVNSASGEGAAGGGALRSTGNGKDCGSELEGGILGNMGECCI